MLRHNSESKRKGHLSSSLLTISLKLDQGWFHVNVRVTEIKHHKIDTKGRMPKKLSTIIVNTGLRTQKEVTVFIVNEVITLFIVRESVQCINVYEYNCMERFIISSQFRS